jgi:L-seryl-tRNA(Ser) seleniumtransferase
MPPTPADISALRAIPSIDELVAALADLEPRCPRSLITAECRRAAAEVRAAILSGATVPAEPLAANVRRRLLSLDQPTLHPVINATGIVLHTNLGRAPLGPLHPIAGYSNLEYDLEAGQRGRRDSHIGPLLERLLGAPALAVNNNAAAVFLALHELASGGEVVISRGELIEIGDGFRIPDIMTRAGVVLREVGTTNRTRVEDYAAAINERTRLILRVHPSNFRITGFTARPDVASLAGLARQHGIPLYEDLGSGALTSDALPAPLDEPLVRPSLQVGVHLVSFSGDKLLGGPQAGILAGEAVLITRLRRNPLYRALRLDKLILESLAATLRAYLFERYDEIPTLAFLAASYESLRLRAARFAETLTSHLPPGATLELTPGESFAGGGATPAQPLPTCLIRIACPSPHAVERRCRLAKPAVLLRLDAGCLLIDLRAVFPHEEPPLARILAEAINAQ